MGWKDMSPEEQVEWLTKQQEDIRQVKAVLIPLLERFEKFTQRRLKHIQAQGKKK